MRTKKIRGHKRLWKSIEDWRDSNLHLDLESLMRSERDYVKIWVHPFSSISMLNSQFPEPKGKTRTLILESLLAIYDSWKTSLDSLDQPYYLKIWLNETHFSNSQVVCAIGNALHFYDQTFHQPETVNSVKIQNAIKSLPTGFNWELRWEENHLNENEIGDPDDYYSPEDYEAEKRWFDQQLKKPHRTSSYTNSEGTKTTYYSFKTGIVWLGDKQ